MVHLEVPSRIAERSCSVLLRERVQKIEIGFIMQTPKERLRCCAM